jgi:hypothetical protein
MTWVLLPMRMKLDKVTIKIISQGKKGAYHTLLKTVIIMWPTFDQKSEKFLKTN